MIKLRHNKKRNLGLVYEFLTREVSAAVVSSDTRRAAAALGIISNYLSEGKILHEELSLHRQVIESRGIGEKLARRIVDELKSAGLRLSSRSVLREQAKADLIHEMNRTLGRDVFDRYRIPSYTAHASVNILLSRGIGSRMDEGIEVARVEEHLISYLLEAPGTTSGCDADKTMFAYKTAVGLFEQEFGAELDQTQSNLLKEYVRVSLGGNKAPFERVFEKQKNQLREVLRERKADKVFTEDKEMSKRLDEAVKELDNLKVSADDESVERLMLYHNLRREIES